MSEKVVDLAIESKRLLCDRMRRLFEQLPSAVIVADIADLERIRRSVAATPPSQEATMPKTDRRFTDAQRRPFEWLPADGSWRTKPGRLSAALDSLWMYHRDLIEVTMSVGPRGGVRRRQYRLTPDGVKTKAPESDHA